jgi:hypothetical protein
VANLFLQFGKNLIAVLATTSVLGIGLLSIASNVYASEEGNQESEASQLEWFPDLSGNEKVLELPCGGYLHGSATLVSGENGNSITFDSNTDTNSIKLDDLRDGTEQVEYTDFTLEDLFPSKLTRGTTPPTSYLTLSKGDSYTSNPFSGSGWRYAGLFITRGGNYSANATLTWTSSKDSGRVGDYNDLMNLYINGNVTGTAIAKNGSKKIDAQYSHAYYTYNPATGTQYTVSYPK